MLRAFYTVPDGTPTGSNHPHAARLPCPLLHHAEGIPIHRGDHHREVGADQLDPRRVMRQVASLTVRVIGKHHSSTMLHMRKDFMVPELTREQDVQIVASRQNRAPTPRTYGNRPPWSIKVSGTANLREPKPGFDPGQEFPQGAGLREPSHPAHTKRGVERRRLERSTREQRFRVSKGFEQPVSHAAGRCIGPCGVFAGVALAASAVGCRACQ